MKKPLFEFGCFVCGKGKSNDKTHKCGDCGTPFDVAPMLIPYKFGPYSPVKELGRGFYGSVLLAKNNIGRKFAIKICSSQLYQTRQKSFLEEMQRYMDVGDHPNISELLDAGETDVALDNHPVHVYYLATKYIPDAVILEDFIKTSTLDVEDILGITVQICAAISRLEGKGLWHNDLHGRNILLTPRTADDYDHHPATTRHIVKVVDFGSAIFRHPGPEKEWQDIQWLGKHLDSMLKSILPRSESLPKADRWFLRQLPEVIDEATDENPGRQIRSARDLEQYLSLLWQKSARYGEWQPVRLQSAFGFTNANQFPDDSYVKALFSDNFPWLGKISEGESTILLTGPRGCGKTMILKSFRLRSLMARQGSEELAPERRKRVQSSKAIGFFVSARLAVGLYRTLGETPTWLETPALSNAFFILAFLQEVIDSFLYAEEEDLKLLTSAETQALSKVVGDSLSGTPAPSPPSVRHFALLERLSRRIDALITSLVEGKLLEADIPPALRRPQPLYDVWDYLTNRTNLFRQKRIVLLLDDFTQPLIPEKCQRAFLPIMFGTPQCPFIISAHSRSVALEDLSGVRYDASREFTEINLGAEFVKESEHATRCEEFLDDIFRRRFDKANVFASKTLRDLLGPSRYEGDNVAAEKAFRHAKKKLRGLKFHGVDTVVQLCTGDISSIIDLLGNLFRKQKAQSEELPITPVRQNAAIRLYARREMMKILDIRQSDGRQLYEIAVKFGQMSREKILIYARSPRYRRGERPPQFLRIEVEQNINLPKSEEEKLRALLQHGIFVDGGLGAASNGTPTQVLIFRKLFCPVFPTGITSQNSFSWSTATFSLFLRNPRAIRTGERRKAAEEDFFEKVEDASIDFGDLDDLEGA